MVPKPALPFGSTAYGYRSEPATPTEKLFDWGRRQKATYGFQMPTDRFRPPKSTLSVHPTLPWNPNGTTDSNDPSRNVPEKQKGPRGPLCLKALPALVIGAGDGIRTHDPNLGKVMLYP